MIPIKPKAIPIPSAEDFSDRRLRPLFDKTLLRLIHEGRMYEKHIDELVKGCINEHHLYEKDVTLLRKIGCNIASAWILEKPTFLDVYTSICNLDPHVCEACRQRTRTTLDHAHIVKKESINRRRRAWADLDRHYCNFLLLCPTCHRELDRGALGDRYIKRIVRQHKKRLAILKNLIRDGIETLSSIDYVPGRFDNEIVRTGSEVLRRLLREANLAPSQ